MQTKDILIKLAGEKLLKKPESIESLQPSGSDRQYYRCLSDNQSILIVENNDVEENISFWQWAKFLSLNGINVPSVEKTDFKNYLFCKDLGDNVLYSKIKELIANNDLVRTESLLKRVLLQLIKLQTLDPDNYDGTFYPVKYNSHEVLKWDLYYFKYNFLKIINQKFNEVLLEKDFNALANSIVNSRIKGLQYRDFQSRNIMLKNDKLFFIDFQSIRIGSLLYDAVSLLYQSRLDLPKELIDKLKRFYKDNLKEKLYFTNDIFEKEWNEQALIRSLQNLGAYGYLGLTKHKKEFIFPIRKSIENLNYFSSIQELKLPELNKNIARLKSNKNLNKFMNQDKLTLKIQSFSFKKGLPVDETEHGGGYIFDCRSIHNPGRYEKYKKKTGQDSEVQEFFELETEMQEFFGNVFPLISSHIDRFLDRKFEYLSVAFGCTGGQHRSVYSAEKLAEYLIKKYGAKLNIVLKHRELE